MEPSSLSFHCWGSRKARTSLGRPVTPDCDLPPSSHPSHPLSSFLWNSDGSKVCNVADSPGLDL